MSKMCMSCGNYLTEGADCPDCVMSDALVKASESDQLRARVAELERECDRLRQALQVIVDPPMGDDAADPDDVAKEALRLKTPAFDCLKCFPGEDCPEDCLDRNHRVTDN